jgi:hypothetical protein
MEKTVVPSLLRAEVATCIRPCAGEFVCGDLACWKAQGDRTFVLMLDATGHGKEARAVAEIAERTFATATLDEPTAFLALLDDRLRGTRGAAAALARLDLAKRQLTYAGIGNTSARVIGARETGLVCRDGTLGQRFRTPTAQSVDLRSKDLLVMHSDGISGRFSGETLADFLTRPVEQVATALLERYGKAHDDTACVVVRVMA